VHHATLSRLLRGSHPIPAHTLTDMGARLGIAADDLAAFSVREDAEAIVMAIGRPTFRPESRWLARVVGISIDRVNISLQALLRNGHLRMLSKDLWRVEGAPRHE